jgi:hypothetical protein
VYELSDVGQQHYIVVDFIRNVLPKYTL